MKQYEQRNYRSVSGVSSNNLDYVPANGETVYLSEIGGNASGTGGTSIQVIWDPNGANEIIFVTRGDSIQKTFKQFTGDGSKILRVRLINNDITSAVIGGYVIGETST